MAKVRDPFGMALEEVRSRLRRGALRPGGPLVVSELAVSLQISVTPIREALCQLAGEGLIEDRRGRGFYAASLDVDVIEELFELHGAYVDLALQRREDRAAATWPTIEAAAAHASEALGPPPTPERFWSEVVQKGRNKALSAAHRLLSDRLAVVRGAEGKVVEDAEAEISALSRLEKQGDIGGLRLAAAQYHSRRQAISQLIASSIA